MHTANEVDEQRLAWDKIAAGYDRYVTDSETWLAGESLRRVNLQPGMQFLDVAAGCGGLSLPAARLGASVSAIDWSPEMISLFKARVHEEGLSNAEGKIMDAHDLAFEDNRFDVTGSLFGAMLLPDQPKALREMVRVTKPGGRVLTVGYGTPDKVEFINVFIDALKEVRPQFPGLPSEPPPPEFQAAHPAILATRLTEAGLVNVRVDEVTEELEFSSGNELWNWTLHGNPIVSHLLSALEISDSEAEVLIGRLEEVLQHKKAMTGKAVLCNGINIGYGVKS